MTIEELEEIVKKANSTQIKRALKARKFKNCKLDSKMRKINLVDIVHATYQKDTRYYPDGKGNEFTGTLYTGAKDYPDYDFVIIEKLAPVKSIDILFTKNILIYAKCETGGKKQ